MGYYTNYEIQVKPEIRPAFLAELEFCTEMGFHMEENSIVSDDAYKWYEHDDDMIKLSAMFPEHRLSLYGVGEDRGDIWVKYYHGGKNVGQGKGRIVYDPPPWEGMRQ